MAKPTIFISYSHRDKEILDELLKYLGVALEEYGTDLWTDQGIPAGGQWNEDIYEAMEKATLVILLVSVDSLRSDYIRKKELPFLMEERKLPVIPIIVRQCPWKHLSWLSRLQVLPADGRPLTGRDKYDIEEEMTSIAGAIVKAIKPQTGAVTQHRSDRSSRRAPPPSGPRPTLTDKDSRRWRDAGAEATGGPTEPFGNRYGMSPILTDYRVNFTVPGTSWTKVVKDDRN